MALDCNATFPLQVHVVKYLSLKIFRGYCAGKLKQAVGKCALAMVNMCDYTEVTDIFHAAKLQKIIQILTITRNKSHTQ